jgi:predicted DsbA family dithiol-disulfide isomerase
MVSPMTTTLAPPHPSAGVPALPMLPVPWRVSPPTRSSLRIAITHVTDPLCPWAYSFEPVLRTLESRYGDQLEVRTELIGLVSTVEESLARGSSAEGRALTALRFRRFGMPITPHVRERVIASAPACRLVKAAARQGSGYEEAILRALRLAWYTTDLLLDMAEALTLVCRSIEGLDAEQAIRDMDSEQVLEAYQDDRAEARTPAPAAVALRRTANSDGAERHTAPTLVLTAGDGRSMVVPGFQPFEAVDVALMNLEPRLMRLPVPGIVELLASYPGGLTSQEIARVLADTTAPVDRQATEPALTRLAAEGQLTRTALGDDALWTLR